MPQRWNDREGRFDVEADGDFDRNRGYGYDTAHRGEPAHEPHRRPERDYRAEPPHRTPSSSGRRPGGEFLRGAQQGGDIGYGRIRSGADYGGTSANRGWDRAGGHDFGGATGDYGSSGYASRTADYGDERYFDHRDRDRYGYGGEYGRHNPYRSFGPNGAPNARDRAGYEEDRSWFDRARDEVSSWMGDHDAQRRRELDGEHRGRGPKGYRRSDERIRDDVSDRLTDDSWLDAQNIEVAVADSDVTLSGSVRSREDKRRAEALAESVSGVDNVQNNLRVDRGEAYATAVPVTPPLG